MYGLNITGASTGMAFVTPVGLKARACLDSAGSCAASWPCGSYYAESYGNIYVGYACLWMILHPHCSKQLKFFLIMHTLCFL